MADSIIAVPLGATHGAGRAYYRFDGSVWKYWNIARNAWVRCEDNKPFNNPTPLPPSEQSLCCGTTCDKRNVAAYIERLEAVANAARGLPYPVAGAELIKALKELDHG